MPTLRSLSSSRVRAALAALAVASLVGIFTLFRAEALLPTIDLAVTDADFTLIGRDTNDRLGVSVAAGDINGDTVEDLIVGAPNAGNNDTGETYLVYGRPDLAATIDLAGTSPDLTVSGEVSGDTLGWSVGAGDINGDTTDDLIIGNPSADRNGRRGAGETYVIYGGPSLPATIDLNSTSADLTVFGDDADDRSGFSVAAGDINGDTTNDLIIGAWRADPAGGVDAGESYVIYGGPSLPATIDLNSTSAGLTVFGDDAEDESGWSVAAGDIDGDTTDDLIIGAPTADPAGGIGAGETYVIFGGPGLPATIDLDSASAGLTVFGDDTLDQSGRSVAAGDIDGDTTDDLIMGAAAADPSGGSNAGETYLIYGGPSLPATIDLDSTSAGLTVFGDDAQDLAGSAVAAGDIDGDTVDDLIIGAYRADGPGTGPATICFPKNGDRCGAGETYVIYGGPSLPITIDLSSSATGLTVFGADFEDSSGSAVAAGDINGDTVADLMIGAPQAVGSAASWAGKTYVIYGGSQTTPPPTSTPTPCPGVCPTPPPTKQPHPGDTDGDGCSDKVENGPDEREGGRRNYLNPWDFYDVNGDTAINIFDDIFGVAGAFGETEGSKGYFVELDRTSPPSEAEEPDPNKREPWDLGPPDGVINVLDDIFGVMNQFGHGFGCP